METERFPGRLAELRTAAGLTQQQLAEKAVLTRDGIAQLETGRRSPSWETVLALCTALGVSCEAFRTVPAETAKKGPGRPRKAAAEAGGANVGEAAADRHGGARGGEREAAEEVTAQQTKGKTMFGYYYTAGAGHPAALAAKGLFLHVDVHKRSWVCQASPPGMAPDEEMFAFLRLIESVGGRHDGRPQQTLVEYPERFPASLDEHDPPQPPIKQTYSERDVFVSETKHFCTINDAYSSVVKIVRRLYNGRLQVWYGVAEVACTRQEFCSTFVVTFPIKTTLEDGAVKTACLLDGRFHEKHDEKDENSGSDCECYFVGTEQL